MKAELLQKWQQLLISFSVPKAAGRPAFDGLVSRYAEPGRYYHTLTHIAQVLETTAALQPLAGDYPAIQLAAWFHDAVYDPHSADNEARSAAYAEKVLSQLIIPETTIARVQHWILATATHTAAETETDAHILLDADLAILGAQKEIYDWYSQAIRREYDWVAEEVYRPARVQVLTRFLKRPRIYHTPPLFNSLESQARQNLANEIAHLS
jgi:predicted metal-dependent HD superfamily phosphohydrolase